MVESSYRTGTDPTDQQWTIIEPLFEEKRRLTAAAARGATRVQCSTGALWVRTGARVRPTMRGDKRVFAARLHSSPVVHGEPPQAFDPSSCRGIGWHRRPSGSGAGTCTRWVE